ncbi:hypothetical protein F7725_002276 [Dissostichus mawsoni]|uniref:Transmembrane protein 182 n=1 Tax=Dissostichus mawsoni TaxID=36200 RepID=A0A7J5Y455_DISMA|nr:hypothetical protein F7725_002276 [Dissostichus mawsoni]
MKLNVALFFAGLFGALAAVFTLLSFGTDYWLMASESCHPNPGDVGGVTVECSFGGSAGDEDLMWKLWFIYRGFWSIFMLIGVAAVLLGVSSSSVRLRSPATVYIKQAGASSWHQVRPVPAVCVVMYVLWVQVLDVVELYIENQRSTVCADFQLSLHYGLSFMFAPVGIFFCFLAGLLFLLIGRTIQIHCN